MTTTCDIRCEDAVAFLRSLEPGSMDLLLADPPYGTTNCTWDACAPDWPELWPVIWRALKPHGAAIVFSQMRPALDVILPARKAFRYNFVWEKSPAVGHLNSAKAPMRKHELMLVFYRKQPTYNQISIPTQNGEPYSTGGSNVKGSVYGRDYKKITAKTPDGTRVLHDVIKLGRGNDERRLHPTRKPSLLLRYLIRAYSNPGELVVDPFCGSGSCAEAALLEGRRFAGCDICEHYTALARERVAQLEKTAAETPADAQTAECPQNA